MAQVNFRMDDSLKAQADAEFRQMGLTFSAAITLLCTQVVMKHRLPFAIEAAGVVVSRPNNAETSGGGLTMGAGRGKTSGGRFLDFIRENPLEVPVDFEWSRAEANERRMKCLS